MTRKLRPLNYNNSGQDDMFLVQLRQKTRGLEDLVSDDVPNHSENIMRRMYRELERILLLGRKEVRLDQMTPHFLYSLFETGAYNSGLLSDLEENIVANGFKEKPLDEAKIPIKQRSSVIKRLSSIGLEIEDQKPMRMEPRFFLGKEPIFFRNGMPSTTVERIDKIIEGTCTNFPDWLRMRFGTRSERKGLVIARYREEGRY